MDLAHADHVGDLLLGQVLEEAEEDHGSLPLARAITHRFPLSRAAEAMETALRGDGAMKVVIEPQRRE